MNRPPLRPARLRPRQRRSAGPWIAGLLPVLLLLAAGVSGQQALTANRYPDRTGVVGEIPAGRRVGQTFVTRLSGLDGVELYTANYEHALTGTVVLHIRATPADATDLATVRVPAATLPNNDWITFAFPPLTAPPGTPLYLELQAPEAALGRAPTIYWYSGPGDPYGSGGAILDGTAQPGDLAFGLHYHPPLLEPWAIALQTLAARLPTRPAATLPAAAVLLLLSLGIIGSRLWALGTGRDAVDNKHPNRKDRQHVSRFTFHVPRFTLPVALIAVTHAWLWLWMMPPWQGPDEAQHVAAAALLARQSPGAILTGGRVAPADAPDLEPALIAAMDRHNLTRLVPWYGEKGGSAAHFLDRPAFGGSSLYVQTRQPSAYYRLGALVVRLLAGDGVARLDPDLILYALRCVSLLLHLSVVAGGAVLARLIAPDRVGLHVALPLTLALLPMPVFIATVANNDVLAAAAVAATALAVGAWLRLPQPWSRQGAVWGALATILAAVSVFTKSTAAPALLLVAGAAVVVLAWQVAPWWRRQRRRARVAAGIAVWLALVAVVEMGLHLGTDSRASAWGWSSAPGVAAARQSSPTAHDGGWVLAPAAGQPIAQRIDLPPGHPALRLDASGWLRGGAPGPAQLLLALDGQQVSTTTLTLAPGPAWTPITVTATAPAGITYASLTLVSPGAVQADSLSVQATTLAPGGALPPATNLLNNPSAEERAVELAPALRQALRALPGLQADELAAALLNPLPFDAGVALREDMDVQWRSFWGLFGWLAVSLPGGWYSLWAVLGGLALVGLLFAWPRLSRVERAWVGLTLLTLVGAWTLGVGKAWGAWALYGLRDAPQGRYLFVLLPLISWLLLTGARGWLHLGTGGVHWAALRGGRGAVLAQAAWPGVLWLTGFALLVGFAAAALVGTVLPYYYGN